MSYKCQECGVHVPHGTKMKRMVSKTRTKKYPEGGIGHEIVTEKAVCGKCKGENK